MRISNFYINFFRLNCFILINCHCYVELLRTLRHCEICYKRAVKRPSYARNNNFENSRATFAATATATAGKMFRLRNAACRARTES